MMHRQMCEAVAAAGCTTVSELGLRFDRVVARVVEELARGVDDELRADRAVVLTLTAPLRVPGELGRLLKQEITVALQDGHPGAERSIAHRGNDGRLRLVECVAKPGCGPLVFVHNPDVDASVILDLAERWLRRRA